jgi:hypothetical protein
LLRPSFVPPRPFRELRDLTRYRKALIRARTSVSHNVGLYISTQLVDDVLYETV